MKNYIILTFIGSILGFIIRIISIVNLSDKPILSFYNFDLVILGIIIIFSGFLLFGKGIKSNN